MKTELPSILGVGIRRIGYELKSYIRTPDAVFFNFFFPLMMLVIFTAAFSNLEIDIPGAGRVLTSADVYLPAMLAMGVLVSGTQNLGIDMAIEKHDGTLRRLSGSPISPVSYFIGKFGQVFSVGDPAGGSDCAHGTLCFWSSPSSDCGALAHLCLGVLLGSPGIEYFGNRN